MLRILQLEDDPVDCQLAWRLLREGGLDVEIERVHTFNAFKECLERNPPVLILADYRVPGVDVFKALEWSRQILPEVPFVFLSGTLGEDVAIETLKLGATDYVLKQRITRLVPAVRRALQEARVQLQRQQAEQDLRESEFRYRALVELAPNAVLVCQDWRLVYLNAAALRLCGAATLDEMWGKEFCQFLPPAQQEALRQTGQRLLEGAPLPVREIRVRRLDGQEVPVEIAGSRVEWLGQPAVQLILRDITEHKRIEQDLQSAREELLRINANLEQTVRERSVELGQALEDLRRFSYAIVHDMRAPLRAMQGFATLLEAQCAGREAARALPENVEFLQRIRTAAERLDCLIVDALNYSRVLQEKRPPVPVDLGKLLRDIIQSSPNLQPSLADVCVVDPLPVVFGSEKALTQCFRNLLDNAVKFVAPGVRPRVRVWAEPVQGPELEASGGSSEALPSAPGSPQHTSSASALGTRRSSFFARLWVQDNGIGIAPEHQNHIFGMFQRLNLEYEGTGIGLAIVQKAVEHLGGRVGLQSAVGQGSKFWVELPCANPCWPGSPTGMERASPANERLPAPNVWNPAPRG
jgi:PAS domain S-box-containing protein